MGLIYGDHATVIDLVALILFTLFGYGWAGIPGAILSGGTLLCFYIVLELCLIRPAERVEEMEDELTKEK